MVIPTAMIYLLRDKPWIGSYTDVDWVRVWDGTFPVNSRVIRFFFFHTYRRDRRGVCLLSQSGKWHSNQKMTFLINTSLILKSKQPFSQYFCITCFQWRGHLTWTVWKREEEDFYFETVCLPLLAKRCTNILTSQHWALPSHASYRLVPRI